MRYLLEMEVIVKPQKKKSLIFFTLFTLQCLLQTLYETRGKVKIKGEKSLHQLYLNIYRKIEKDLNENDIYL